MNRSTNSSLLWLFFLVLVLAGSASAQNDMYRYSVDLVKAPHAPGKMLLSTSDWNSFLKSGGVVTLDNIGGISGFDDYSLTHPGIKNPVPYRDPRPDMFQVQYTDLGFKADIQVKKRSDGKLTMTIRTERSQAAPVPEHPERRTVVVIETTTVLKKGQTAIIGRSQGMVNSTLRSQFPSVPISDSDSFLVAVTIE